MWVVFFEICVILTMTAFRRTSISFRICLSVWDTWFSCFIGSPCNVKKCPNNCQLEAHKCWQLLRWSYAVTLVSGLDVMDEMPMTKMPLTFVLGVGVLGLGIIFCIGVLDDERWVTSTGWCFKMLLVTQLGTFKIAGLLLGAVKTHINSLVRSQEAYLLTWFWESTHSKQQGGNIRML